MRFFGCIFALLGFASFACSSEWQLDDLNSANRPPDSIGVGYHELIGERTGTIGTQKTIVSPSGILELAARIGLIERTISGFEPHVKEEYKLALQYRERSENIWKLGWTVDGESYRDRQIGSIPQRGIAGTVVGSYNLQSDNNSNLSSDILQRRGRIIGGYRLDRGHRAIGIQSGIAYDEDYHQKNWGPAIQTDWQFDSLNWSDWEITTEGGYRHSWLRPREDGRGTAKFFLLRNYADASTAFNLSIDHGLRDIVGVTPFRRSEWRGQGLAQFLMPAPGDGQWRLNAEWDGSQIKQGARLPSSSQLRQEYLVEWSGVTKEHFVISSYKFGFQNSRSGTQIQKDRSETFVLQAGLTQGRDDTLQTAIEAVAIRTDTPDTLDYNDRDQYRYHVTITGTKKVLPGIWLSGDGSAVILHDRYLSKFASSSNRQTNTYQLGGSMFQHFADGFHRFRTEVSATYVLYDFTLTNQPYRDVLSRRLSLFDSLSYFVSTGEMIWNVRSDFEDRGMFDNDRKEQSLSEAIRTVVGTIRYRFPLYGVNTSVGIAAYERQPYRYQHVLNRNERIAEIAVAGLGPTFVLERSLAEGWQIYGEATLLVVSRSPRGRYMQNTVNLTLSRLW